MAIDFEILRSKLETLSPQMQAAVMGIIDAAGNARSADDAAVPHDSDWLNVADAARLARVNPTCVHRAVHNGEVETNGCDGKNRRVNPLSFYRWSILRPFMPEPEPEKPHPKTETFEEKRMKLLKARIDREAITN